MSTAIVAAKPASLINADRRARILELFVKAQDASIRAKETARRAISDAAECGRLLLDEKAAVESRWGRGCWLNYLDAHYPAIARRTAQAWMKLAHSVIAEEPVANVERAGLLALEFMPDKAYPAKGRETAIPRMVSHLTAVNSFSRWAGAIEKQKRRLTEAEKVQLRADFKTVWLFLDKLFSNPGPL